ncbi:hypothetical protein HY230_11895 [Candidatus Acetothermia bacterium]|nr:hypothetical protein [Candidatus Acetothermia bacterium]
MIRLKLGHLVIRATLLEVAGFFILLPGLIGIFTHSLQFGEALLLIIVGLGFMQDRFYVRWAVQRKQRRLDELIASTSQQQESQKKPGEI